MHEAGWLAMYQDCCTRVVLTRSLVYKLLLPFRTGLHTLTLLLPHLLPSCVPPTHPQAAAVCS